MIDMYVASFVGLCLWLNDVLCRIAQAMKGGS